jgi:hypothetical protein
MTNDVAELKRRLSLATEFTLTADLVIASRGHGKWAVTDRFQNVLNRDQEWEHEPMPSNRTDEFIARTRFSLDEAFSLVGATTL